MKPINLRTKFGKTYRIEHDPAAKYERAGKKNPWLFIIPCRKGHIYPHSDKLLALWWESSARLDTKNPALKLYLDGDAEKVYLFSPDDFDIIKSVAHPSRTRKGRKLSPAAREAAIERLRQYRFRKGTKPAQP